MTTPGGVPNLPAGALTLDNLASATQDHTPAAVRARAAGRVPSTFDVSNGGNMMADISPFGIIGLLFAAFTSGVANADPNDIQGPDDLPGALTGFIESLPLVGEFVELFDAITGAYTGDDPLLLAVQDFFAPIRGLAQTIIDAWNGLPTTAIGILGQVGDAIAGLLGLGTTAMREITALKGQLLAGDGSFYTDDMAYTSAAYLPSPYVRYDWGSGAGSYGPNGSSALAWKASGAGSRGTAYRQPDFHIGTGKFGAAVVLENVSQASNAFVYIGAVDASGNGLAMAIGSSGVGLVTVTGGVPAAPTSLTSTDMNAGDSWEIYYGTGSYPRGYAIRKTGGGGSLSSTDCGITLAADIYAYIGGCAVGSFFTQAPCARMGSYTFFESSV